MLIPRRTILKILSLKTANAVIRVRFRFRSLVVVCAATMNVKGMMFMNARNAIDGGMKPKVECMKLKNKIKPITEMCARHNLVNVSMMRSFSFFCYYFCS